MELLFEKEENNNWYVVLPEWEGSKEELQMVSGADTMLDIIAQGNTTVILDMDLVEFEGATHLELTKECTEDFTEFTVTVSCCSDGFVLKSSSNDAKTFLDKGGKLVLLFSVAPSISFAP